MKIASCQPYHSRTVHHVLLQMGDGQSAFKVYYLSIIGRDDPGRYEWAHSPLQRDDFERRLTALRPEGIGFVTAFPHITKVFRFAPSMETVLHVRAYDTAKLKALPLAREDDNTEFACYAEAAIAADEYQAWAGAATVEEYLAYRSSFVDGPIANPAKLRAYVAGA